MMKNKNILMAFLIFLTTLTLLSAAICGKSNSKSHNPCVQLPIFNNNLLGNIANKIPPVIVQQAPTKNGKNSKNNHDEDDSSSSDSDNSKNSHLPNKGPIAPPTGIINPTLILDSFPPTITTTPPSGPTLVLNSETPTIMTTPSIGGGSLSLTPPPTTSGSNIV